MIFTIHFGGKIPLFLVQHPYKQKKASALHSHPPQNPIPEKKNHLISDGCKGRIGGKELLGIESGPVLLQILRNAIQLPPRFIYPPTNGKLVGLDHKGSPKMTGIDCYFRKELVRGNTYGFYGVRENKQVPS